MTERETLADEAAVWETRLSALCAQLGRARVSGQPDALRPALEAVERMLREQAGQDKDA